MDNHKVSLGRTIIKIANETGIPKDITDMMLKQEIKDLIINSAKLNPRTKTLNPKM